MERVGCPPIKRFADSLGASLDDLDQRFAMYAFKSNESALSLVMTEKPLSMYGNSHRVVARDLVVVEGIDQVGMRGHEGGNETDEALYALVGAQRHVDVAGLDVLQRGGGDVRVHDQHVRLGLQNRGHRTLGRPRLGIQIAPRLGLACRNDPVAR